MNAWWHVSPHSGGRWLPYYIHTIHTWIGLVTLLPLPAHTTLPAPCFSLSPNIPFPLDWILEALLTERSRAHLYIPLSSSPTFGSHKSDYDFTKPEYFLIKNVGAAHFIVAYSTCSFSLSIQSVNVPTLSAAKLLSRDNWPSRRRL